MNVSDIMTEKPITVRHDQTLYHALGVMEKVGCRHLPVVSLDKHMIGIITSHDCHVALNLPYSQRNEWRDIEATRTIKIREVMTPAPIIVEPHARAAEAARLMLSHQISALPVMRGETLIGIVTSSDILMAFIRTYQPKPSNL